MAEFDFTQEEKEQHNRATEIMLEAIKKGKLDLTDEEIWINADPLITYTSIGIEYDAQTSDEAFTRLILNFGENYQRVLEAYQESLAQKSLEELRGCQDLEDVDDTDTVGVTATIEDFLEGDSVAEQDLQRNYGKHYQEVVDAYQRILEQGEQK